MKFLTGEELSNEIYDIIYYAEKELLIISPFINLGEYFKNDVFIEHLNNSNLHIIVCFGKNEEDVKKSLKKEDFEYFIQFPNISLIYIPKLHGKYYGNSKKSVLTSINLIDYSFKYNIEFGVYSENKVINNDFFKSSKNKCFEIIENEGNVIFAKRPKYNQKKFLNISFGKDYSGSDIKVDLIDKLIENSKYNKIKLSEIENENYTNPQLRKERVPRKNITIEEDKKGYCIRCNTNIKLDIKYPYCYSCHQSWDQYKNPYYKEQYCISCGEIHQSNLLKPACYNCYKENFK